MSFAGLLIHRGTLRETTENRDANLLPTQVESAAATGVPCRVVPLTAKERGELAGEFGQVDALVYFAAGTDLQSGYDLLIEPNGGANDGVIGVYELSDPERPQDRFGTHHVEAYAVRNPLG